MVSAASHDTVARVVGRVGATDDGAGGSAGGDRRRRVLRQQGSGVVGIPDDMTVPLRYDCADPPPVVLELTRADNGRAFEVVIEPDISEVMIQYDYEVRHAVSTVWTRGDHLRDLEDKMLWEVWSGLHADMEAPEGGDSDDLTYCTGYMMTDDDDGEEAVDGKDEEDENRQVEIGNRGTVGGGTRRTRKRTLGYGRRSGRGGGVRGLVASKPLLALPSAEGIEEVEVEAVAKASSETTLPEEDSSEDEAGDFFSNRGDGGTTMSHAGGRVTAEAGEGGLEQQQEGGAGDNEGEGQGDGEIEQYDGGPTIILGLSSQPTDAINDDGCILSSRKCTSIRGQMSARYAGSNEFGVVNHITHLIRSGADSGAFLTQSALALSFSYTVGIRSDVGAFIPLHADPVAEVEEPEPPTDYISEYGILFVTALAVLGTGCLTVMVMRRRKAKRRAREEKEDEEEEGEVARAVAASKDGEGGSESGMVLPQVSKSARQRANSPVLYQVELNEPGSGSGASAGREVEMCVSGEVITT